jgi:hypothetical protein
MMRVRAVPVVAAVALALAGCGGDDEAAVASTLSAGASVSSAPSASGGSSTVGSGPTPDTPAPSAGLSAGGGCTAAGPGPPDGASTREVADLDGDARPDTVWLATGAQGSRTLGVVTSAGGSSVAEISSSSPEGLRVLTVDADETAPTELFVSDGRTVQLWAFDACALAPVTNPEGEAYLFDLGLRGTGTGVGCVEGDGGRRLVGLNVTDDDGTTVRWTRTVIELDHLSAANGESSDGTFTHGPDDASIDLLHAVSCGDETIQEDGLAEPDV